MITTPKVNELVLISNLISPRFVALIKTIEAFNTTHQTWQVTLGIAGSSYVCWIHRSEKEWIVYDINSVLPPMHA